MGWRPRTAIWASALAIGAVPGGRLLRRRRTTSPTASPSTRSRSLLVLLGPLALARRDRWPLVAVVVASCAADLSIGLGYAYGPIFVSVVVALFWAVLVRAAP